MSQWEQAVERCVEVCRAIGVQTIFHTHKCFWLDPESPETLVKGGEWNSLQFNRSLRNFTRDLNRAGITVVVEQTAGGNTYMDYPWLAPYADEWGGRIRLGYFREP